MDERENLFPVGGISNPVQTSWVSYSKKLVKEDLDRLLRQNSEAEDLYAITDEDIKWNEELWEPHPSSIWLIRDLTGHGTREQHDEIVKHLETCEQCRVNYVKCNESVKIVDSDPWMDQRVLDKLIAHRKMKKN